MNPQLLKPLFAATIFSSAFLLFLVQPLIAKQILPWFGGSAAVWSICMVFFQVVLLAGYAYSDWLTRLPVRIQSALHILLLMVSLAILPIVTSERWKPSGAEDPTLWSPPLVCRIFCCLRPDPWSSLGLPEHLGVPRCTAIFLCPIWLRWYRSWPTLC